MVKNLKFSHPSILCKTGQENAFYEFFRGHCGLEADYGVDKLKKQQVGYNK